MSSQLSTPHWVNHTARVLCVAGVMTGSGFLTSALGAGEETKLTRETIPVNPESDSQFTIHDVENLEGFFKMLQAKAKEDGDSAEKHIYSLIGPARQAVLTRWENEDQYSDNMRFDLIVALNQIVRRDDVYVPEFWEGRAISSELKSTYGEGYDGLSAVDQARANRKLFAQTWSAFVAAPVKPKFVVRPKRLGEDFLPGDKFLGSGNLQKGFKIPIFGTVWQPNLLIFGNLRSRIQTFDDGLGGDYSEWVNALNINFNLALTPTERLLVTFTPLHQGVDATGVAFDPVLDADGNVVRDDDFEDYANGDPQTFFFEGDLGEIFPNLDPQDKLGLDFGFAVGRQPIEFQRGFMVSDELDSVGITKNNIIVPGTSNLRITGLYAWDEIDRNGGLEDNNANLWGLFTAWDLPKNTVEIDYMFVSSDIERPAVAIDGVTDGDMALATSTPTFTAADNFGGDSHHIGASSVQRVGLYSTSLHVNASLADEDNRAAGEGLLFFGDISYTPPFGKDLIYGTAFYAVDQYSAVRRPLSLGPLAPAGILFEGPGIGRVGAPLSNLANDVAGGAVGYQKFFNGTRTQLITELGGRVDTASGDTGAGDSVGLGFRLQHAIGQHWVVRGDAAISTVDDGDERVVAGAGIRYQF